MIKGGGWDKNKIRQPHTARLVPAPTLPGSSTGRLCARANWRDFWPDDIIGIIRRLFTGLF
ncbi:hypothetical protein D1BOALGB6SA_723 [Olavius sp. associated proteobacterium Delta 1]|nr:hypothetical protein D1BOALGB6SA_723 [Olavius sp. associated proteobacterium Delta 1]